MKGVNKAIIVGNLGADPEVRYTANGSSVTNISVATTESWTDKNTGEKKESTEWHRVVFFGRLAEVAGEYLKKGRQVYVEGKMTTEKWQDENGNDRYSHKIVGREMQMLGGRDDSAVPENQGFRDKPKEKAPAQEELVDSDIPF